MDNEATEKKLPNLDANFHKYDELDDRPEESSLFQKQKSYNNNLEIEGTNTTPSLPAPKQIQSLSNAKSKLKSKIPRSPSLAGCLSNPSTALNNFPEGLLLSQKNFSNECRMNESVIRETPFLTQDKTIQANQNAPNAVIMGDGKLPNEGLSPIGNLSPNSNGNNTHRSSISMVPPRRPQTQTSLKNESPKNFQYLTLTVRKDENGYGMKVSGDNPVFVESVKAGGAAQVAGLVAGDMILKVNGQEVRSEKHPTVVSLIKASTIVELSVKRSHKVTRPSSVNVVPSTPILSGRDRTTSITGPQPVDSIKRREMESYKIHTLQKMLEQEKINLERLKSDTNNPSYKLSETNIRKLREQLRQIGAEDAPATNQQQLSNNKNNILLSPNQVQNSSTSSHQQTHHQFIHQSTTPQPQSQHSSPAFLSLLPRSLSSLSLGTRKNKIEKDNTSCHVNNANDFFHNNNQNTSGSSKNYSQFVMSQSLQQPSTQMQRSSTQQQLFYQQPTQSASKEVGQQQKNKEAPKLPNIKSKNKFGSKSNSLIEEDIPPPLPQRNPPRQVQLESDSVGNSQNKNSNKNNSFALISDLDFHSPQRNSLQSNGVNTTRQHQSENSMKSKRSKTKTKALSDPKMSTQMFLLMESTSTGAENNNISGKTEVDCTPPPLPPRQSGLADESHRGSFHNLNNNNCTGLNRTVPNSVDSILNYPLVSTCTVVHKDNLAVAFPLSQRPNIVQQLHQYQQQQLPQQQKQEPKPQTSESALGQTPQNINLNNKHRRAVSSPENMQLKNSDRQNKANSGSWELIEKDGEITPPGTPPPPYLTPHSTSISDGGIFVESHHFVPISGIPNIPSGSIQHSNRIQAAQSSSSQKEIMSMEDEDASDQEGPFIDENGPFNYFQRLLETENVGFLAVFLNYVLSNSEPAPLLFYLITGLYKEGTAKDMRKWAYEIHSTFLVPRAPLAWYRQDESLAREVDNVLQTEFDKVEILRKVFWKSRKRARDIICNQLRDFQQKRAAGLGTIYGPTDAQLTEAKGDKQKEQHIFEETLMRKLQILIDEHEKELPIEDPKKLALCSALSTVIHRIFITRTHPNNIVDRVHHFVSREKSFKSRIMAKSMKKITVRGHPLVLRQYYEVTHCNHCQTIIWGVRPQGYHCTDCKLNIHRACSKVLDESCPGPVPQSKRKDPHNDNKISKIMGKIRPRTSSDFIAAEKRGRHEDEFEPLEFTHVPKENIEFRTIFDNKPSKSLSKDIEVKENILTVMRRNGIWAFPPESPPRP